MKAQNLAASMLQKQADAGRWKLDGARDEYLLPVSRHAADGEQGAHNTRPGVAGRLAELDGKNNRFGLHGALGVLRLLFVETVPRGGFWCSFPVRR